MLTAVSPDGARVELQVTAPLRVTLSPAARTRLLIGAKNTCWPDAYSTATHPYHALVLELPTGSVQLPGDPLILCDDLATFASFESADD
jgi:hypothetical protein